jgi:hypothetical protein
MKEFLASHLELIVGIITVGVFAAEMVRLIIKARKIDREGIETDAEVSRIDEVYDPETVSSSYTTYVRYTDRDGQTLESAMDLSPGILYSVGDRVRIKYIPGERELVRKAEPER